MSAPRPPFRPGPSGVAVVFDEIEASLLAALLHDLVTLLGDDDDVPADPLEALLGSVETPVPPPADPALARLLPDAYPDDAEAGAEFRRYTDAQLRGGKRTAARTALGTLAPVGRMHDLTSEEAQAWLKSLNDLRLVLGTRLGVTEDDDESVLDLPEDDPRLHAHAVYDYLTWLQESLLECLAR